MPIKDPANWSTVTWLLLLVMSFLGGLSSWYRRVKEGHARAFNIIELIGEISVSGMMGFVGFVTADAYFDSQSIAAACAGMSAHFATRLLFGAEGLIGVAFAALTAKIEKK